MKLSTFRITVSVPDHLCDTAISRIATWVSKKCVYYHVVTEHGTSGKKHLHAAIVLKTPAEGNNVLGYWWKIVQEFHPTAIRRYAMDKKVMYDHVWYDDYLRKEDAVVVVASKYTRDEVAKYFPSETEQESLMNHVVEGTSDDDKDKYFGALERTWIEYNPNVEEVTFLNAVSFLKYRMNVERTMNVISDPRRLNQTAWALYQYRARIITPDVINTRYQGIMEGTLVDGASI